VDPVVQGHLVSLGKTNEKSAGSVKGAAHWTLFAHASVLDVHQHWIQGSCDWVAAAGVCSSTALNPIMHGLLVTAASNL